MIKKDYIKRLTQQIAQLIAQLLGKSTKESLELIEEHYVSWFKLNSETLRNLAEDQFLPFLTQEKNFRVEELEFLAEIMGQEGRIYFNENDYTKSKNILKKALILFEFVDGEQALYALDRQMKMQQIKNQLAALEAE